jgi:NB-ARC domain-containing protein
VNGRRTVLLIVLSTVLSVALAVAVNVATGGDLPEPLARVQWLAWPVVGVLLIAVVMVSVQQVSADRGHGHEHEHGLRPAELPVDITWFAGREGELAELLATVPRHQETGTGAPVVIGIFGAGGMGKSVLATRLAHTVAQRYPDGQLAVSLRGASPEPADAGEVLRRLLHTLGVDPADVPVEISDRTALFRSLLADRRMLIFLDDAASEAQVRPLLPGARGCLVLVTARPTLIRLPLTAWRNLDVLTEAAAIALLAAGVGDDRVADELEAAKEVARHCGWLPLALSLAAARLRSRPQWTVAELARRLSDEYRRLDELSGTANDVRASFQLSYNDLDPVARNLFRGLSLLGYADFGRGVSAALLGGLEHLREAENALDRLADVKLIEVRGPLRYRLHDLVRLYAAERLDAEEPTSVRREALQRALNYYRIRTNDNWAVLQNPESAADDRHEAEEWFARSRSAIVASVKQAVSVGETRLAREIAAGITPYLERYGYQQDLSYVSDTAARLESRFRPRRPR